MAGMNITKLGHNTESVIHWIAGVARSIASVLLALMVLLISVDVFGRYVLNRSIKGAVDIIEEILIFIVFLGMAEVAAKNENIKVDLITSRLSQGTQLLLYCFIFAKEERVVIDLKSIVSVSSLNSGIRCSGISKFFIS